MLVGHHEQREAFLAAREAGRLHHAWLLGGPRGVGKRRFADWAALKLLSGEGGAADVDPEAGAARLVQATSHPDHRALTPPVEGVGSATGAIVIEQVRDLAEFLHSTPALSEWRVLVVDGLESMNPNTANAFLKELEEPRGKTVYLMVSHAPGRLLPTIRSRCRMLRFGPLSATDSRAVLAAALPEAAPAELDRLAEASAGAPGSVAGLADADVIGIEAALDRTIAGGSATGFARSFQAAGAVPKLTALLIAAPRRIATMARRRPDPRLLGLYEEAEALARDAVRLAYDRVQVAVAVSDLLARAGRIERELDAMERAR